MICMADSTNSTLSMILIGVQLIGMVCFYAYYTIKNKQAEKEYWQRVNSED